MTFELTRRRLLSASVVGLLGLLGLTICCAAYLHKTVEAQSDLRAQYLRQGGDAPAAVQAGVRRALREFQYGYVQRDPNRLDAFMDRLFEKNEDVLILGTDRTEWIRGYPAAKEFIRADWLGWGDLRFDVDDSIISSCGDVAWMASVGSVHLKGGDRPVRIAAVLTWDGDRWVFRQVHFQWEGRGASWASLLRLKK